MLKINIHTNAHMQVRRHKKQYVLCSHQLVIKSTTLISHQGNEANAAAGFELMAESHDQKPVKGLHNKLDCEFVQDGVPIGIKALTPPLPKVWSNLYSSWNLAFVSGVRQYVPMLWAKLLAPIVLGTYQEVDPGLYMAPRVICLYMMLQYYVITTIKTAGKRRCYPIPLADGKYREYSDWHIKVHDAAHLLGRLNKEASKQFHARFFLNA